MGSLSLGLQGHRQISIYYFVAAELDEYAQAIRVNCERDM